MTSLHRQYLAVQELQSRKAALRAEKKGVGDLDVKHVQAMTKLLRMEIRAGRRRSGDRTGRSHTQVVA